jgi:hypothetical protein
MMSRFFDTAGLTTEEITALANAALEIFEATAIDLCGSLADAEDTPASEIIECGFTADRIDQFCDRPGLSDTWRAACELDYDTAKFWVARELKRIWGF